MNKNKNYINRIRDFILTIFLPLSMVVLWQISTNHGWVRQSILPSPQGVWKSFQQLLANGIFFADLKASVVRIAQGYILGTFTGIVVGIIIGISPAFDKFTKIVVGIFRPIPMIALIPFFILWLGIGEQSKVALIAIGTFWSLLLNTSEGIKSVDKKLLEMAQIVGKTKIETIIHIVIPYALPFIFTGMQYALSISVSYVVTSEMIAAANGIGYRIMYARNLAQPGIMMVGVIEIGLLGAFNDIVMRRIQEKLYRYR